MSPKEPQTAIVLHDIRSVHNVGAIFRTADAFSIDTIYLCGYTPTPIDRFGRVRQDFIKCSLGAEKSVQWKVYESTEACIADLKNEGFSIVAYEQHAHALLYSNIPQYKKCAYVFGNEIAGLPESVSLLADTITEIPMHGTKESLNVSVTVGIALAVHPLLEKKV